MSKYVFLSLQGSQGLSLDTCVEKCTSFKEQPHILQHCQPLTDFLICNWNIKGMSKEEKWKSQKANRAGSTPPAPLALCQLYDRVVTKPNTQAKCEKKEQDF